MTPEDSAPNPHSRGPSGAFHEVPFMFAGDGLTYDVLTKSGFVLPTTMPLRGTDRRMPVVICRTTSHAWAKYLVELLNDEWERGKALFVGEE